jgi:competence ComEA-like helix-hairpin-helix protein
MGHNKKARTRINWLWVSLIASLVAITLVGVILAATSYDRGATVEISLAHHEPAEGTIDFGDGFAIPGSYPFSSGETIGDLIAAAGGPDPGADPSHLELTLAGQSKGQQRVDVNRAGKWLLEALPGVGEVLAQRIIDFRQQNGPFANTVDITRVSGLGMDTFDKIKNLVTVNGD